MARIGAPEKPFDWNMLESLAILEAELRYVAERMLIGIGKEVNETTLQAMMKRINRKLNARFKMSYVQYRKEKEEFRKTKLRQLMWKAIETGNVTMQIWMSKQILGYADKVEQRQEISGGLKQEIVYTTEWGSKIESDTDKDS